MGSVLSGVSGAGVSGAAWLVTVSGASAVSSAAASSLGSGTSVMDCPLLGGIGAPVLLRVRPHALGFDNVLVVHDGDESVRPRIERRGDPVMPTHYLWQPMAAPLLSEVNGLL